MDQVAEGSEAATRKLVLEYLDYVVALAYRVVNNRHDAEEIAQEVFLKLFKQAENWESRARISTWLYRVTYNRSIDHVRSRKRHNTYELKEELQITNEDFHPDLNKDFSEQEILALEKNMGLLSEQYRVALTIFYFQNKRTREAAEIMELNEDAFESLLRRARKKLKNLLNQSTIDGEQDENEKRKSESIFRTGGEYAYQTTFSYK